MPHNKPHNKFYNKFYMGVIYGCYIIIKYNLISLLGVKLIYINISLHILKLYL